MESKKKRHFATNSRAVRKHLADDEAPVEKQDKGAAPRAVQAPTHGPEHARIAFVGASLGKVDAARREPFVGPGGETLREIYLKPLGLRRDQVVLTNVVPLHLTDADGATRLPQHEEIQEWRDWLAAEIERLQPNVVVALGRAAESALGDLADHFLPHPSAVRRFGDSGEVKRKLRRIKDAIRKSVTCDDDTFEVVDGDDGVVVKQLSRAMLRRQQEPGHAATASQIWDANWHEMLPASGRGRWVYQHHWRGLSNDETHLDDSELMGTLHSLHGDLRLEGDDALWGWAVLLGRSQDNRGRKLHDKLIDWQPGDKIELAPKLAQPKQWLEVGRKGPLVTEPGEVGATSQKSSKFFALDWGSYELGVARKHFVEVFLTSHKLDVRGLNGRYLIQFAPVGDRRRWLIDKPEDQTPTAEKRELADLISELRRKRQKLLIWSRPGEKPRKIDVRTGRVVKDEPVKIQKADPVKRIVYGAVIDPYGESGPEADAHNDWTPPAEVEKTAHEYMKSSRVVGLHHRKRAKGQVVESWIEQYPSRREYLKAMAGVPHRVFRRRFGDDVLHSGSWVLGVELPEAEWAAYERGEINAFSPAGLGVRSPMSRRDMPAVTFVDLVEKPALKSR